MFCGRTIIKSLLLVCNIVCETGNFIDCLIVHVIKDEILKIDVEVMEKQKLHNKQIFLRYKTELHFVLVVIPMYDLNGYKML